MVDQLIIFFFALIGLAAVYFIYICIKYAFFYKEKVTDFKPVELEQLRKGRNYDDTVGCSTDSTVQSRIFPPERTILFILLLVFYYKYNERSNSGSKDCDVERNI